MLGLIGQMRVPNRSENRMMTEDLLHLDQIDAGFDQVSCIAVAQTVGCDLFFRPQA